MASLAEAGVQTLPLLPAGLPLPPFSCPPPGPASAVAGELANELLIDRCQDRLVAQPVLTLWQARGTTIIGAGLASTSDRLTVAAALAHAGVPRPVTHLAISAEAAEAALEQMGYPATFLPLPMGSAAVSLLDVDVAEAVLEHRMVLGSGAESMGLVQQGTQETLVRIIVVDGVATAVESDSGHPVSLSKRRVAEHAAQALNAGLIAVDIVDSRNGPVVWDVQPAPDFRGATPLGADSVAEAVASMVTRWFDLHHESRIGVTIRTTPGPIVAVAAPRHREVAHHGVVLTV